MTDQQTIQHSSPSSGLQVFNLVSLSNELEEGSAWKSQDRATFTLNRSPGLHVTLIAMHSGTMKPWHQVECPISLHVLRGTLEFITDSETVNLKGGDILVLKEGIRHHMRIIDDSVVLLSLATNDRG